MHTRNAHAPALVAALVALLAASGCGSDPGDAGDPPEDADPAPVIDVGDGGEYDPGIDAGELGSTVDNPYFPLLPGSRWVYEGESDGELERIEVEVLEERRQVFGVDAVVVRDRVFVDDQLVEYTQDWYAQDQEGNVWYLGEETAEYEDGEVVTTAGSWEAGVDGALPGIVMLADPQPGEAYRQEFYEGEAEDLAQVLRVGQPAAVVAGPFDEVISIREWNPFEPETVEEKHYAPGVGLIMENKVTGDGERLDLVAFTPGG